ncbi:DUF3006 domain-containing protein [Corallococcus sp. AB049A]|uniref:DUF3006 domain-containing protein n=1 Tax=Corallococcus interemptor TaxID=2316720 RepID=A0A3A8QUB3_9BACT|nr:MULTISPECIES: DUF3006 domain-containing protein [Corallococcus]RKH66694.1 DUF3006 domain-containing protein [Corallococcus interemptor]RKI45375.1 DUF3006 domain-containing protein [Corallococcus sp. AB049A]
MTKKAKAPRSRATVDRIEDDVAVLVVDGRQVTRALDTLPAGVREGDVVDLEAGTVDAEATESLRADVRAAREQAMRGKKPPSGDFDL